MAVGATAAAKAQSIHRAGPWQPPPSVLLLEAPWSREVDAASRLAVSRARAALERVGMKVHVKEIPDAFAAAPEWLQAILSHDIAAHHGRDLERAGEQMSVPTAGWRATRRGGGLRRANVATARMLARTMDACG